MIIRIILCFLMFGVYADNLNSQTNNFKNKLDEVQLSKFKDEIRLKYQYLFESILNILDDKIDISSRYNSRSLLLKSFASTNSTIVDNLDEEFPRAYTVNNYSLKLFELENKKAVLYKKFKFSDSVSIVQTVSGINTKYSSLGEETRKEKIFAVYKGQVFFLEEMVKSKKTDNKYFTIQDQNRLKEINFRIIHNEHDQYKLSIESIDIVHENDANYEYNDLVNEIKNSSLDWSDSAEQEYLEALVIEAKSKGIFIDIPIIEDTIIVPNGVTQTSDIALEKMTLFDYTIPGLGFNKRGSDLDKKLFKKLYPSLVSVGIASGIYFGIQSNSNYDKGNSISDFQQRLEFVKNGDKFNRYSIASFTGAALTFLSNMIHVRIKDLRMKNLYKRINKNKKDFGLLELSTNDGLGLKITF